MKNFQFYNYVGKSEIKLKQEGYNLKAFIFLFIYNYKPHICYSSFLCALVINHYPSPLVLSCCLPLLLTSCHILIYPTWDSFSGFVFFSRWVRSPIFSWYKHHLNFEGFSVPNHGNWQLLHQI